MFRGFEIAALALLVTPAVTVSGASAGGLLPPDGSGTLSGIERFNVPGCGREDSPLGITVNLSNGTWTGGGSSGTAVALNEHRRQFDLAFSGGSIAALESDLEDWASDLCGLPVTITFSETKRFRLKFDKTFEEAKVQLTFKAEGFTKEGEGKGTYKLTLEGPWAVAD